MRENDVFYAKTHAEFLNKNFGTNYKAWGRCCYNLSIVYEVWMIRFDGRNREGWKNSYNGDTIKDENIKNDRTHWANMKLPKTLNHTKLVFEIIESNERKYVFKGVYQYQQNESNPYKIRVYKKIAEEFPF